MDLEIILTIIVGILSFLILFNIFRKDAGFELSWLFAGMGAFFIAWIAFTFFLSGGV